VLTGRGCLPAMISADVINCLYQGARAWVLVAHGVGQLKLYMPKAAVTTLISRIHCGEDLCAQQLHSMVRDRTLDLSRIERSMCYCSTVDRISVLQLFRLRLG
jgi:hypothetical protein